MDDPRPTSAGRVPASVKLDDKYTLEQGRAFMSGIQALVRLPMMQTVRDARAGLNTAGFISGYCGSPLGGYDQALSAAAKHLADRKVVFQPGLNEELAATAVWGTQQLALQPEHRKHDGMFGIWYGKGPGADRCADVFKHTNLAGTSPHGRVLAVAGDDHAAKSSTAAHQSDHLFKACGLPVCFPSDVQGILDMGLARLCSEPVCGNLGGDEDDPRGGGVSLSRGSGSPSDSDQTSGGFSLARLGSAYPLARRLLRIGVPEDVSASMRSWLQVLQSREKALEVHTGKSGVKLGRPGSAAGVRTTQVPGCLKEAVRSPG
jgi:hypothetical protein